MAITVTVPASNRKLADLATLKAELGITNGDSDALLNRALDAASARIVSYTGREFAKETLIETLPGSGSFTLMLTRTPVLSITGITADGVTVSASDYVLKDAGAGLVFSKYSWLNTSGSYSGISRIPNSGAAQDLYAVTYQAGYALPGEGSRTLPFDIEQAALMLATGFYQSRQRQVGVKSEDIKDVYRVEYFDQSASMQGGMPADVAGILDPWRRYA